MKLVTSSLLLSLLLPIAVACTASTDPEPADEPTASADDEIKLGKKKSCASVGGACVGLSPSSCVNGTWADAKEVSCGGGIGVGCCIENPTPPPPPPPPPCPVLSPPGPGFCPNGIVTPKKNAQGCTIGFTCEPATPNACEAAGGECVGLSPTSCNGIWADASKYSCGGGLGVGCCVLCPALSPPGPGFCPNGTITPKKNDVGCVVGFTCTPSEN